jgi:peroxiredoxin
VRPGNRILIGLLLLVGCAYGMIAVYHLRNPVNSSRADSFLERCRKTCLRYGLVPTGNIRRDAQDYLKAVGADSSRGSSRRWKVDPAFTAISSQPHALLGHPAPGFVLFDDRGVTHELATLVARGPVVVVFYYGFQCSHCVAQLYGLSGDLPQFGELGVEIVAISSDSPEHTAKQLAKYGRFGFTVLADPENRVAEMYEVCRRAAESEDEERLHGTFLIDREGQVVWAYRGNEPFTDNASLLSILASLPANSEELPSK